MTAILFNLLVYGENLVETPEAPGSYSDSLFILARDPFLHMWAGGSVASNLSGGVSAFCRPIGTSAIYAQVSKPVTQFGLNHTNGFSRWIYLGTRSDPLKTVAWNGGGSGWNLPWQMHIPNGTHGYPFAPSDPRDKDSHVAILGHHPSRDEWHWYEYWRFANPTSDGGATWSNTYDAQIMFTGDPDAADGSNPAAPPSNHWRWNQWNAGYAQQGHFKTNQVAAGNKYYVTSGNVSQLRKTWRKHELEQAGFPLRWAITVGGSANSVSPQSAGSGVGWQWPCIGSDGSGSSFPMGSLFAIRQNVDVENLGLSELGVRVARQLQRYGMYVTDTSSNHTTSPGTQTRFTFNLEESTDSATKDDLVASLNIIFPTNPANAIVERVTNNLEAQSASGGGTPLGPQPYLPNVWNTPGTGHTVSDGVNTWRMGAVLEASADLEVLSVSGVTLPVWDDSQGTVYLEDGYGNKRAMSWSPSGFVLVENGVTLEQYPPVWNDPPHAPAATYYIDATGGSDGAAGTSEGTAWKTFANIPASGQYAVMLKRGGTWNETLNVRASGTSGNYIKYGTYGTGNRPIINGQNMRNFCIDNNSHNYLWFDGLDLRNGVGLNPKDGQLRLRASATGITITDCLIQDSGKTGLGIKGDAVSIHIKDCSFLNNGAYGLVIDDFLSTNDTQDFIMTGCLFSNNAHIVAFAAEQCTIQPQSGRAWNNIIENPGNADISAYLSWNGAMSAQSAFRFHDNIVDLNGFAYCSVASKGRGYTVYRNKGLNAGTSGGRNLELTQPVGENQTKFFCNVAYVSTTQLFSERNIDDKDVDGTIDGWLWNNTFHDAGEECFEIRDSDADLQSLTFVNNLISEPGSYVFNFFGAPVGTITSDYNYSYAETNWGRQVSTDYTLANWRTSFSRDLNSIDGGDPLFIDATNVTLRSRDYGLQSGSPARSAGTDVVPFVSSDPNAWIGINYVPHATSPDCGAYQYLSGKGLDFSKWFLGVQCNNGVTPRFKLWYLSKTENYLITETI